MKTVATLKEEKLEEGGGRGGEGEDREEEVNKQQ